MQLQKTCMYCDRPTEGFMDGYAHVPVCEDDAWRWHHFRDRAKLESKRVAHRHNIEWAAEAMAAAHAIVANEDAPPGRQQIAAANDDGSSLPPRVRAEVERILDAEARRLLDEQLATESDER
jgi:hypothetical protein